MKKVLYIGFGYPPFWGGGMVVHQIDLLKNLQEIGQTIGFFAAGRYDFKKTPYLNRTNIEGIETIELVNSPNPYDPFCYRTDPERHCSDPNLEKLSLEAIEQYHPDLVHFGDLRMYTASLIAIVKEMKIPVVKTIHNFWDLCPRSDLLFRDAAPCHDYEDGGRCLKCLTKFSDEPIPFAQRLKGNITNKTTYSIMRELSGVQKKIFPARKNGAEQDLPFPKASYQKRRGYFIEMLQLCDIIHTVSMTSAHRIIAEGVDPSRISNIPLSLSYLSQIKPKPEYHPHHPVVFGYRGALQEQKGIRTMLIAFSRLESDKCRLVIYGQGDHRLIDPHLKKSGNITYHKSYRTQEINQILNEIDLGIVPSICEETFGIVGIENNNARIPTIGSNLGGITEWLKDGVNGMMFKPGDDQDLTRILRLFINNPSLIVGLQKDIKPWKDARQYASEVKTLYDQLLS